MGDMESFQSARRFRLSLRPTLPPMRKVSWVLPETASCCILRLISSLEQGVPSIHRATSAPPLGSFAVMAAASASRACWIWAGEGSSGRRLSGSSKMSNLQYRPSRLAYSAVASR